ncbi:MAG: excinuclease ABC subunit UvrC [bacterium]
MDVPEQIQETLDNLPAEPGVYMLKGSAGEILYVGKAKRLSDRVPTYFGESYSRPKTKKLASLTESIETIVVPTEQQALEVEYDLIKEHRPRFNVAFRDNKRFPYIKITMDEPYPRVLTTRQKKPDGSCYFGPYTNVGSMRKTLETIRDIFPYRSCSDDIPAGGDEERFSICMDYHINHCEGPCEGRQSVEDYGAMIEDLCSFLNGQYEPVRDRLKEKMEEHAENHEYEAAAIYRDRLEALEETVEYQPFIESTREADIVGVGEAEKITTVVLFSVREHHIINRREFPVQARSLSTEEAIQDFLMTYYPSRSRVPKTVLLEKDIPDRESIEQLIEDQTGSSVTISVPEQGEKRRLIKSAKRTAEHSAKDESLSIRKREGDVLELAKDLFDLSRLPRMIEGFDISTNQGQETVAGMVRFVNGEPEKQDYRRFKIRDVEGVDDYDALREAVHRRYTRLLEEDRKLPDLIFVDGGRGQLSTVTEVLDDLGVERPVVSLAKDQELLFVKQRQAPYDLPEDSKVLQLFQRIRDEVHRFAISYHRDRRQGMLTSSLKSIDGIGDKRLKKLIEEFGSPARARQASIDELTDIPGITTDTAQNIKRLETVEASQARFD